MERYKQLYRTDIKKDWVAGLGFFLRNKVCNARTLQIK